MREYEANGRVLCLHDVTGGELSRLPLLLRLMAEFFPNCEKFLPALERHAGYIADAGADVVPHQWLVEVDGETAGFYIFDYRPERGCGLSLFMGLYPPFRDVAVNGYKRLAHFLFIESVRQIRADAARFDREPPPGLVGEIEIPALVSRYRHYDFVELPVVYYEPMFPDPWTAMSPDVDPDAVTYEPVTLGLFHGGDEPKRTLTAAEVTNMALAYLSDFYNLPPESMPVQRALATAKPFDWT